MTTLSEDEFEAYGLVDFNNDGEIVKEGDGDRTPNIECGDIPKLLKAIKSLSIFEDDYIDGLDLTQALPQKVVSHIWTLIDAGDDIIAATGFHRVNRIDWVVTEKPWTDDIDDAMYHQSLEPILDSDSSENIEAKMGEAIERYLHAYIEDNFIIPKFMINELAEKIEAANDNEELIELLEEHHIKAGAATQAMAVQAIACNDAEPMAQVLLKKPKGFERAGALGVLSIDGMAMQAAAYGADKVLGILIKTNNVTSLYSLAEHALTNRALVGFNADEDSDLATLELIGRDALADYSDDLLSELEELGLDSQIDVIRNFISSPNPR